MEDQDRTCWSSALIEEGTQLVDRAFATGSVGVYTLQAAISAEHGRASSAADTDWARIVSLYDLLVEAAPSPVIELNRAVAVAMRDGPASGLVLINSILHRGDLDQYHLAHAARAAMCRRLGYTTEALVAYQVALALARQEPERRFLEKRIEQLK